MVNITDKYYETTLATVPPGTEYGKDLDNAFEIYLNTHHLRITGESEDGYSGGPFGSASVDIAVDKIEISTGVDTDAFADLFSFGDKFNYNRNMSMKVICEVNSTSDINLQINTQDAGAVGHVGFIFRDGTLYALAWDTFANLGLFPILEYAVDTTYVLEWQYTFREYIKYYIDGELVYVVSDVLYLPIANPVYPMLVYLNKTTETDVDDKIFTMYYFSTTEKEWEN